MAIPSGSLAASSFVPLRARLGQPIDVAGLAVFRVLAGVWIAYEAYYRFRHLAHYTAPRFHFHYPFFSWVQPWPEPGVTLHIWVMVALAVAVAAGFATRIASWLLFFTWTALFLMERSGFVNHHYLYVWVTLWLALLPTRGALSLDVWRRPELATPFVPAWTRAILMFQMGVVYFFAGLAKLDPDWLSGLSPQAWLGGGRAFELVQPLMKHSAAPLLIAWGGLLVDLTAVPFLLWRRTRPFAFVALCAFHVANWAMLGLASFPWFSIAATTVFLDPSWPRRLPIVRSLLPSPTAISNDPPPRPIARSLAWALTGVVLLQTVVPLRHHLYRGDVAWSEEGALFSWRMMVRTKPGWIRFRVEDPSSGKVWRVDPASFLGRGQLKDLPASPDMILQFAHFLAGEFARHGHAGVRVFADGQVRLNTRPPARLVDPNVDLAAERWTWRSWFWILPSPRS